MQTGSLWSVLGLCLLSVGVWGQEETEDTDEPQNTIKSYKVSISGTTVKLECPEDFATENVKWEINGKKYDHDEHYLELENFSEMENSGYYSCYKSNSKDDRHYLYLKAKVCENCIEVDLMAVAAIIIADICLTLGLLLLVYYWSKNRKAKAKPVTRRVGAGGRPIGQNKERPPPVPNPDYEPIRKGQRDLYSGLNQRGI
ncbi:T-cell surface glycoprotein CD3 epsilon chain [Rhynchonycteris naso]